MRTVLSIYRGYANEQEIILFGHLFRTRAPRYDFEGSKWSHASALARMFTIKPLANKDVHFYFKGLNVKTRTLGDGYFRFSIPHTEPMASGWHPVTVKAHVDGHILEEQGEFIKPYPGEFGLISDIDDTFLISHSSRFFKKLYVLLTRNVTRRKIFDGVVEHYRLLSQAGNRHEAGSNAFFYVSSSEWNLYGLIEQFAMLHDFPKAVIKLKKVKTGLGDFLSTGRGSHDHKYNKIKHLLEFYPELQFILFGDDTQKDPYIYERIVKLFPLSIRVIYMRQTKSRPKDEVVRILGNIESMNVQTLYFRDSSEAMDHSRQIGLV